MEQKIDDSAPRAFFSERKSASFACCLGLFGRAQHSNNNKSLRILLVISMLVALTGLLAHARHRPTENPLHPFKPQPQGCRKQRVVSFLLLRFLFFNREKEKKMKNYFEIK